MNNIYIYIYLTKVKVACLFVSVNSLYVYTVAMKYCSKQFPLVTKQDVGNQSTYI